MHSHRTSCSPFRILKIIAGTLLAGFVGSILLCAGSGALLVWGAQRAVVRVSDEMAEAERQHEIAQVQATSLAFLHGTTAGDIERAGAVGSQAFQARQTMPEWRAWQQALGKHAARKPVTAADLQIGKLESAAATKCRVILVAPGGFDVGAVLDLVKEGDRWTVDQVIVR